VPPEPQCVCVCLCAGWLANMPSNLCHKLGNGLKQNSKTTAPAKRDLKIKKKPKIKHNPSPITNLWNYNLQELKFK